MGLVPPGAIARAARRRVLENFLDDRQLVRCADLFEAMAAAC
jgi:hypothetical protein